MNKKIEIFTDGSCLGNPGPGGYGIILRYRHYEKILSRGYRITTNNRMEIMAVIIALEELKFNCNIIFNTDSQYVRKGVTKWIYNWKKTGWKNSKKIIIKNIDLWQRLDIALSQHKVKFNWIKGHNGHLENERCDKLARVAALYPIYDDIGYNNI